MKKYRVTSAHPLLKEGYEFTIKENDPDEIKAMFANKPFEDNSGVSLMVSFSSIEKHPTWYEEVKERKEHFSWKIDFMKDNGESDGYGGAIQLTEGEREELTERVAALVRAYQEVITK